MREDGPRGKLGHPLYSSKTQNELQKKIVFNVVFKIFLLCISCSSFFNTSRYNLTCYQFWHIEIKAVKSSWEGDIYNKLVWYIYWLKIKIHNKLFIHILCPICPIKFYYNYVTPRGGRGLGDALRTVVNTTLKSVTKGEGVNNFLKKRYVIVEQPHT